MNPANSTFYISKLYSLSCFPSGPALKNPPANAGEEDSVLGLGGSPVEGNGNPLQCSCLRKPMDRGAWNTVHEVAKELDMT